MKQKLPKKSEAERARRFREKTKLLTQLEKLVAELNAREMDLQASRETLRLASLLSVKSNTTTVEVLQKAVNDAKELRIKINKLKLDHVLGEGKKTSEPKLSEGLHKKLSKRQYAWVRRLRINNRVIIHPDGEFEIDEFSRTFLVEVPGPQDKAAYIALVRDIRTHDCTYTENFSRKADALKVLTAIREKIRPIETWKGIERWMEIAEELVEQRDSGKKIRVDSVPQTLAFIFALTELDDLKFVKKNKLKVPGKLVTRMESRRAILNAVGDVNLPADIENFSGWGGTLFEKLSASIVSDNPSRKTFDGKIWIINQALEFCGGSKYAKIFPGIAGSALEFKKASKKFEPVSVKMEKHTNNRKVLLPEYIKLLLQFARYGYQNLYSYCGVSMFNSIVMQYATGLRAIDLRRISKHPTEYFNSKNGTLNFQGHYNPDEPLGKELEPILSKVESKVDFRTISNPLLPLVARIIIRRDDATFDFTETKFFKNRPGGWREHEITWMDKEFGKDIKKTRKPFKDISEACCRNTLATALMDLGIHPQEILGHTNRTTADRFYTRLPFRPKHVTQELFYSYDPQGGPNQGVWLSDEGTLVNIAKRCNLYHSFLLGIYVRQRLFDCGSNEAEKSRLEKAFIEEAKEYWSLLERSI